MKKVLQRISLLFFLIPITTNLSFTHTQSKSANQPQGAHKEEIEQNLLDISYKSPSRPASTLKENHNFNIDGVINGLRIDYSGQFVIELESNMDNSLIRATINDDYSDLIYEFHIGDNLSLTCGIQAYTLHGLNFRNCTPLEVDESQDEQNNLLFALSNARFTM